MPVTLSRVRSIFLQNDVDLDGLADSGVDIIRTTLVVTNSSGSTANATNLFVNDPLNGSTFIGVVNISPLATNDAFTAVGNTALRVGGAANIGAGPSSQVGGNLLTNDTGMVSGSDGVPGFQLDAVTNGVSAGGGTFNINADGTFNYLNQAGDTGTDTFTYTIRDAGLDNTYGTSDDLTSIGTVTITLTGEVWYIDSSAAAGGTGTSANPFNSVTAFNAANGGLGVDGANDYIYVKGNATGQLTLENNEHLIGTGSNLVVGGFTLATATGTRSDVTGSSGFTVTLAGAGTGNEITGIDINGVGGISGLSFGSLTVTNATIDVSGQALSLNSGGINAASTGFVSTDSDGGTNNVALTGVNGTLALGTGAMSGATGSSFLVSGGVVTTTYSGNVTQATAGQALIDVQGGHSGTLTFSTGTLSATNGTGLQFNNADGTYNLNGTNTLNGGDAGVDITNGSAGNFSFSANSTITNPSGIAFRVDGGNGNIDYNGTIAKTSDGRVIDVQNHSGGTISFDGTVSSTTSSDGILLATNTGTNINFTNTLTLNTSTSGTTAFSATGGGTITATAANNTINSGAGTGLNIQNTNIGLADVIFQTISSSGAANGINLSNTGTSASFGGLIVTGDGTTSANGSGGIIANSTGAGISLNSTRDVVIDQVNISGGGNDGITATSVVNFSLTRSNLTNNGNADEEHGIDFTEVTGGILISDTVVRGSFEHNLKLTNTVGTIDTFNVKNSTFDHTSIPVSPAGGNGLLITLQGTAILTDGSISASTFRNNVSNGILINTENSSRIGDDNAISSSTNGFIVTGSTFDDNNIAIQFGVFHSSDMTVEISNNSIINDNRRATSGANSTSTAIVVGTSALALAGSTLNARIDTNTIGSTTFAGSGSSTGSAIRVVYQGLADTTILINNNTIREAPVGYGIEVDSNGATSAGQTVPVSDVTVTNNNVNHVNTGFNSPTSNSPLPAIAVTGDNQGTAGVLRANVTGNTVPTSPPGGEWFATYIELFEYTGPDGILQLVDNAPASATATAELQSHNTGSAAASAGVTLIAGPINLPPDLTALPLQAGAPPPAPEAPGPSNPKGDATGGEFTPPTPPADPADPVVPPSDQPIVVDDGIVSQAELDLIVEAAIQRWADAGASAADIAAMRAVSVTVASMNGLYLGSSDGGRITLDDNAAGFNWFIDTTPDDDSEYTVGDHGLIAIPGTVAAIRVDLLTTVMHELGHQIGLQDSYIPGDSGELMYGLIYPGERRLPDADDVAASTGTPTDGTDFAVGPIGLGTLLPGQSVTVQWDSTAGPYSSQVIPTSSNVSTITYNDPAAQSVTSNANTLSFTGPTTPNNIVLDTLTLGGTIWRDNGAGGGTAFNGIKDGLEPGIDGVALSLFADSNNDDIADGAAIATLLTSGGGNYSFINLAPGNYIVQVDADNFNAGGNVSLVGTITASGTVDPDNNIDNDDNGAGSGDVRSTAITLAYNSEPDGNPGGAGDLDGDLDADTNFTLDFGFIQLNQAPVNSVPGTQTINEDATRVFNTVNGNLISISDADAGVADLTVTLAVSQGVLTLNGTVGLSFSPGVGDGTADATMTFTGTAAAINTALNGLTYTPTAHFNGSDTLTITTSDNGNTGADPGNTGGASDEQDSDPITINITAVNDAPTVGDGTESAVAINEDTPHTSGSAQTVAGLFGPQFSDAADQVAGGSTANGLLGIAIVVNGSNANGTWEWLNGAVWTAIGAASQAAAKTFDAGTQIRFNPATDFNGPAPTLTAHLVDNSTGTITNGNTVDLSAGGSTGGTTRYSAATVELSQDVNSVNDAPTQSGLNGDLATWTENGGQVGLDLGGNAAILDVDSADFGGGSLTVLLSGGVVAEDGLFIRSIGNISFDATTVSFNSVQFATYLGGGFGGGNISFSFDTDASLAAVTALVQALAYDNNGGGGEYPTGSTRAVTWTLVDGDGNLNGGSDTLLIGSQVSVVPLNDSPTLTVASPLAVDEQVAEAIAPAGTLADLDLDARGANGDYAGSTLTIEVSGGATAQDVLSVVNGAGFTVNGSDLQVGALVFATVSGGNGTPLVISFTSTGTPATSALADAVLQAVQYTYTGDSPPASIQLDLTLNDGAPANADQGSVAGNPATGTATITVNITDLAEVPPPVIVDLNGDTATSTEGGPTTALLDSGTAATVTDADSPHFNGGNLTVSITANEVAAEDRLGIEPSATVTLSSGTDVGSVVSIGGNAIGTVTANGINGNDLVITFNTTDATPANVGLLINALTYQNIQTFDPSTLARTVSVTVNDGIATSVPSTVTVTVVPQNDPPILDLDGPGGGGTATLNYTENGPVAAIAPLAIRFDDTVDYDDGDLLIEMTNGILGEDVLSIIHTGNGPGEIGFSSGVISYGGVAIADLLPSPGALFPVLDIDFRAVTISAAAVEALMRAIGYSNSSDNPTVSPARSLTFSLHDGEGDANGGGHTGTQTATINITATNDAATITGTITGSVTEAGGIDNGTPGTPSASENLHAADPDNIVDSWQVAAGNATYGTYAVDAAGVWTYTLNDNNAAVQALFGAATLTDTFNALTADGTSQTITITINAQDDGPTALPDAVTTDEATVLSGNVLNNNGSGADNDVDSGGAITVSLVNGAANVGNLITLASGAQLTLNANGSFTYNPNHAFDTTPTPTGTSGAVNTPAPDSFTYTLTGGGTTTVSVSITGLDSNDILVGAAGAGTMSGGAGHDFYFVDDAGDQVVETAGQGYDVISTFVTYTLAAGVHVEALSTATWESTAAINLTGNELGNALYGNAGVNILDGGGGNDFLLGLGGGDSLIGGAGDDIYFVGNAGDTITELLNEGFDRVEASVSYVLTAGAHVEVLEAANPGSATAINLTGNELANMIYGTAGANTLDGGGGGDVLFGLGGDDVFIGGAGNDFMLIDSASDVVVEATNGGYDVISTSASYVLAAGVEVEALSTATWESTAPINLTGNELGNALYGNAGVNILSGGGGNDYLIGLGGDDSFIGGDGNDFYVIDSAGDSIAEAANEGFDTVLTTVSYTLGAGVHVEALSTATWEFTVPINLTGNELSNALYGNAGANVLNGGGGIDYLIGMGGADTFAFSTALGAGNVDQIFDFVSGTDKIGLDDAIFAALGAGALPASAFVIGTTAGDADDRILYDSATGQLYYDADGNGSGAAVLFATLQGAPVLAASDFIIF